MILPWRSEMARSMIRATAMMEASEEEPDRPAGGLNYCEQRFSLSFFVSLSRGGLYGKPARRGKFPRCTKHGSSQSSANDRL